MRETKSNEADSVKTLKGIDQQDFKELQLVSGYPNLVGLQQRLPGKSTERKVDGAVGSIYVFYLVFGRAYILADYGTISITPVDPDPITIPVLPPILLSMFDSFNEYPLDMIAYITGAGIWAGGPGVCQTRVTGFIDPFFGIPSESIVPTPPPNGGDGGSGGVTPTPVPNPTPIVPTPPPAPDTPQPPADCASMPGLPFQDFPLSGIISITDKLSGNASSSAHAPGAGPPLGPFLNVTVFSSVSPSGLGATKIQENENAFLLSSPTNYEYINQAQETRTVANFAFPFTFPYDAVAYLVGTQALTNGTVIGVDAQYDTTCACLQIGKGGTVSGTITVSSGTGVEWDTVSIITGETAKGVGGNVNYTFIRVFSNTF